MMKSFVIRKHLIKVFLRLLEVKEYTEVVERIINKFVLNAHPHLFSISAFGRENIMQLLGWQVFGAFLKEN